MTRPHIVRADTIDLQDHDAPSAKDHSHAPSKPDTNGTVAAHQAETLREVAEERAEELRSPLKSTFGSRNDTSDLSQYADDPGMDDAAMSSGAGKGQREDASATAQNGSGAMDGDDRHGDHDDHDDDDEDMDDDMMDKISSSPSIEDEDIDFEFVYALHTFVATVEGQANATKGDTMVLLDDSNSYWWLVRVVKDSSIGYLPAEHIETPTERLARLNKHRNIDLSASMLGDTAEKTKNPIKTAMRRRKTKTVAFAAPTYVDYSDHDVSSDEDEDGEDVQQQAQAQKAQAKTQQSLEDDMEEDESAKVEPLKPRAQQKPAKVDSAASDGSSSGDAVTATDDPRGSEDIFDGRPERVTKNGTVRNTDSFFRDETIETKKISLTPGLLRDDTEPRGSNSSDSKEVRQRPSLDRFEKELVSDKEKSKEDKKRKDKKPSAIRSFFSRKDKKKSADDDDESFGKRSMDVGAEYAEDEAQEVDSPDKGAGPQRNASKLQKPQPRMDMSPTRKQPNNVANAPPASLRMVEPEPAEPVENDEVRDDKPKSTIAKILHTDSEAKPPKVTKAKSRVELDDFDSSQEEDNTAAPAATPAAPARQAPTPDDMKLRPTLPGAFPDSYIETPAAQRLDPLEVPQGAAGDHNQVDSAGVSPLNNPPALLRDTSSQEDRSSPISSPSPDLDDMDAHTHRNQDSTATTASTATTSTWNDASLRAFFDSGSEIRDMLVVVNDTTDVPPAGPDHPMVSGLFREQNAKLAEITTQLDNMLGDWLARKQRVRGTL